MTLDTSTKTTTSDNVCAPDVKANKYLHRYVSNLQEMEANGWSVDVLLEIAFGEGGYTPRHRDPREREIILSMYRRALSLVPE